MLQNFDPSARDVQWPRSPNVHAATSALISRYPDVSETELARLIIMYGELSALDMALIISDENLGPKFDQFYAHHRASLRLPFRQYAALIAIAVFGISVIAWALLSG